MPIKQEQAEILRLLAANRSPSAYLAGGLISTRHSRRFSLDIDYTPRMESPETSVRG